MEYKNEGDNVNDKNIDSENNEINEIQNLYNNCEKMKDRELSKELIRIKQKYGNSTEEIDKMVDNCIAEKLAYNIMQTDSYDLYSFIQSDLTTALHMLEVDMSDLVGEKCEKIEGEHQYNEKILRREMLVQFANSLATEYRDQPAEGRTMRIPESPAIEKIANDEWAESVFLRQLKSKCSSYLTPLDKEELGYVKSRLHMENEEADMTSLLFNKLNEITNPKERNDKAGSLILILDSVRQLPLDKQKEALDATNKVIKGLAGRYNTKKEDNQVNSEKQNDENDPRW